MGKGVRFVSSTPLKEGAFEGAKAIFAFDDISQVQIEQDPNIGSSSGRDVDGEEAEPGHLQARAPGRHLRPDR